MVKKVTGFDIARLAGVSQPTVSRALRNLPGTSPGTRRRVLAAAARLDYPVTSPSRQPSRSRRVAIVSADLTNPYYPQLVEPLARRLSEHGLQPVVVGEDRGIEPETLADGAYAGVVLTTTARTSTLPRDLTERGIPHVLVNRVLDHPESPSCAVDNVAGSHAVAALLAGLGHVRVGMINGPLTTSSGRERAMALATALRGHGIPVRRALTVRAPFDHDAGRTAAEALFTRADPPTAIVAGNDILAIGILSAAHVHGRRVPDDLTVIGFDDIPMAGWPLVDLTTVRCDTHVLAQRAVDLLVQAMIANPLEPIEVRVPVHLIPRGTHGPAISGPP